MNSPSRSRSAFITGASSGIGHALALEFAARGYNLSLAARRLENLEAIKAEILRNHPACQIHVRVLDVVNYADVYAALSEAAETLGRIDIVIANAGIGGNGRVGHGHFDKHRAVIETNVLGAMATADAAIKLFRQQEQGQLVVISSVAAFRGMPTSSSYGASKAAIAVYTDAIRTEVFGTAIQVCTIYPGFIDTPINQNLAKRPFLITTARGAKIMVDKIERGVQEAVVPAWPWILLKWFAKWIPTRALARAR